mmetsp:Transcript_9369/g.38399  ORF Transcript_9369/g.38399 Transcript_9369/m.38399 type:complete len:212 (-) Transcript_9369:1558-2193(-)
MVEPRWRDLDCSASAAAMPAGRAPCDQEAGPEEAAAALSPVLALMVTRVEALRLSACSSARAWAISGGMEPWFHLVLLCVIEIFRSRSISLPITIARERFSIVSSNVSTHSLFCPCDAARSTRGGSSVPFRTSPNSKRSSSSGSGAMSVRRYSHRQPRKWSLTVPLPWPLESDFGPPMRTMSLSRWTATSLALLLSLERTIFSMPAVMTLR